MRKIQREDIDIFLTESMFCIDTSSLSMYEETELHTLSKYSPGEAGLVKQTITALRKIGLKGQDIGVITPYRAQVNLLRKMLTINNNKERRSFCEVSTVDGFQGREKEVIIISMVRSNDSYSVGFLSDERRLNVAITRAKKLCIIIGNSEVVKRTTKEDKKRMWKVEKPTFYDNYKNFLNNMYCYFRRFGK